MRYSLPPTWAATADPRLLGSGQSAFHESATGSYSHALSTGSQPPPVLGATNPPNTQILPLYSTIAWWCTGRAIGFFLVQRSVAGSYSNTMPRALPPPNPPIT